MAPTMPVETDEVSMEIPRKKYVLVENWQQIIDELRLL